MSFFKRMQKNKLNKPIDKNEKNGNFEPIKNILYRNIEIIRDTVGENTDIIFRSIRFGKKRALQGCMIYTDGIVDKKSVQQNVLEPLLLEIKGTELEELLMLEKNPLLLLKESVLTIGDIVEVNDFNKLYKHLLSGYVILLLDKSNSCLAIGLHKVKDRGVTESTTQSVIRGPKEGFTESLGTNTALIRRKIKDPRLRLEDLTIGGVTHTRIALMYIEGLTDPKLVKEVHHRLQEIDLQRVLDGGMIEESIQDKKRSPFPTIYNTERPDIIAAGLLEGRITIVIDGTPFALLVPAVFIQFLQSPEDYYQRADISSIIRMIRYVGLLIAVYGPAIYIAVTTFHPEMIPYPLLLSLASQLEGVPLPTFLECTLMLLMFEILREAGIRMPQAAGEAVSIVGAVVIVISGTAIASFILPANNMEVAARILRIGLMLIAGLFGMVGVMIGSIALVLHLCSLRSFGVPYMSPIAPFVSSGHKDTFIRLPITPTSKEKGK